MAILIPAFAFAALLLQSSANLAPGTISVEIAADQAIPGDLGERMDDAVQRELLDAEFTALPRPGASRYVAAVTIRRDARGAVTVDGREAGPQIGAGALSVQLPSQKREMHGLTLTELSVTIRRRDDPVILWAGSAMTAQVEGSRNDAPSVLAPKLVRALFRDFPTQPEGPISVP
jgi:hypothetical protein